VQAVRGPHRRQQVQLFVLGPVRGYGEQVLQRRQYTVRGVRSSGLTFWKNSIFARSRSANTDARSRSTS
jgi:hypothetical protein